MTWSQADDPTAGNRQDHLRFERDHLIEAETTKWKHRTQQAAMFLPRLEINLPVGGSYFHSKSWCTLTENTILL